MDAPLYPRGVDPNDVQKLFDNTQSLEPKAVGLQMLVMTTLSILTVIAFSLLRPANKVVYEPKTKYHAPDKTPPRISDSICGWIPPLVHIHEPELSQKIGLDAVAFLRFLHLLRWIFTFTALVTCGGLLPLDFLYTLSVKPPLYNFLSAMTIRDVRGVRLLAHIGSTYLITLFIAVLVHHHWRVLYRLRYQWFRSAEYQNQFYARTLCVTNIPERRQSDAGLNKIFIGMQLPYPVTSVHIGRRVGHLPELIDRHNETVKELERMVLKCMNSGQSERARPTIRVGGCCGMGGKRVDAIKFYLAKIRHTEAAVQQYRAQLDLRQPENYGFTSISSIPLAHAAARDLRGQHPKGLTIKLAPNPKDIIWKNLGLSKPMRRFRRTIGFVLLLLFCLLSLAPLFPIASLANLDALAASGYIPFLLRWSITSPTTYTLVSGVAPPAIAAVFGYFVPRLMRWLSKYMGAHTFSSLDRVVIARYFTFLVISQLGLFTVVGVIFQSVLEILVAVQTQNASLKTIFENLDKLPARITRTYVDQSSFWLKWFPLQGFLVIFDLAQLFDLLQVSLKDRWYGRTPRDIHEWTKPPIFEYSIHYSGFLFMATVGLLFAPLAPLVSLAAAIVFWLSSWVYKYQLMFVFVTRVESGGRAWNVVINRILFSAMFMQVLMIFTIGVQFEFKSFQFLATIPPLPFILLFKHYINRRFAHDFQYYVPRHNELSRSIVHSEHADINGNKLENRYCNPALHADIFTPMVHSRVMTSLRRAYKGKDGDRRHGDLTRAIEKTTTSNTSPDIAGNDAVVEGVKFTPVTEAELEYDPELYMRDREEIDCDIDSVNSGSSSDNHTHTHPQSMFEYHRHIGRPSDTLHRGFGYESELPGPPAIPASSPPYVGAVWGATPNRQHQRHPSPLSPAPSYQLADNQSSHVRATNEYANETPRNHHITETRRRSRERHPRTPADPRAPRVSRGHSVVNPNSARGPLPPP